MMCCHAKTPELNKDAVIHPLDPLTAKEVQSMKQVVDEAGDAGPSCRYSYVRVWKAGDDVPRENGALVLDKASNVACEMVVHIPAHQVIHTRQLNPVTDG
ncbi:actin binding protein [Phytophthora pseudosyringae]|uniref:Actin binding protein n=1 Tax=Phytophthora pseudosyringae TaxID=221518 RepID=A0A8T1WDE6_9STRA|nr:actin binding protein [Phytophthora pseudosyringae]